MFMTAEECDVVGVVDESSEESSEASSSDDEFPSDIEIVKAAKRLAKKLDIEEISFKTFMNRLAERLDLDDLESKERLMDKRKLIKSTVKSKRSHQVEAELPNDAKIKKAGMKLAETINVQKTSHAHFLKLLSSKMGVDLTPKQTIIMEVMLNCMRKAEAQDSVPYMPAFSTMMPCSPISVPAPIPREQAMLDETRLPVAPKSAPALRRGQSHARKTQDLEEAAGIKHAQGLEWEDPFFDKNDELVAVFDHDYDLMIRFWMKVHAVGHVFFLASVLLVMIFILGGADTDTGMWTLALICEVVFVVLRFYGSCRILKSKVPAYHLAVVREGVLALHDDHINGLRILAALHCFDACLKVSCQSETVPFDQITKLTVKAPGERLPGACCKCKEKSLEGRYFFGFLFTYPFYRVHFDTGSSTPFAYAQSMWGLKESHKFEKLVMGMKGERRDRPTEETNALLRTMLQNQNNVAGIPNAGYRKAQVVPYTASGYEYYPEQQ